ncbi:MAG: hypothetical protein HPY57_13805 [Ignavibacteria bacterium]|nr:hypothetical protein [Ignavibacteria bacterium]
MTYTNHTGGAIGSDTKWDEIGREFGVLNHIHYWYKKPNPKSLPEHEISEEDYNEGVQKILLANKTLKRHNIEKYMHLLARNWCQVKNADAVYAIGIIKGNKVDGGTGWAVQMSIDCGKPVYVFDQEKEKWYFWNDTKFEVCVTPKLTENFAGIGTREINESGINAIRNVYKKTFNI